MIVILVNFLIWIPFFRQFNDFERDLIFAKIIINLIIVQKS